jgi:pyrroline-5-carboxylate reductase
MPNLAVLHQDGVTGWFADPVVSLDDRKLAQEVFVSVGMTVEVDEEAKIDAITAVSGSGPGYFFFMCEALQKAAMELGFAEEVALKLAKETFIGTSKLLEDSDLTPAEWRAMVTSKGGTTEAALKVFEEKGLERIFVEGVKEAERRARELGK